ncbi:MAG: fibronectin/fibrinogen-binding protein [Peptococcaceae bacterium]|nr:fibronectin/fibrinogen-binding protein [Peptococcaceae bacterium]
MALDSITLYHLIRELEPLLAGTRIDKIQQPEKEEVHILLRSPGRNLRLLLNAGSTSPRLHLTEENKKNPLSPPMFCMILRKHLEGGKVIKVEQVGLERIVTITIRNYNERGDLQDYHLHLEIMGKHSNLILVDPQTGIILDGIRRYSHLVSRHREVLPGKPYILPPSQDKADTFPNEEEFAAYLLQHNLDRKLTDALLDLFNGISPELAREIVSRSGLSPDAILDNCGEIDLNRIYRAYSYFLTYKDKTPIKPCLYYPSKREMNLPVAFSFLPYAQYRGFVIQETQSINEAVNLFYSKKTEYSNTEAKRGSLRKVVNDLSGHQNKKRGIYEDTLAKANKGLDYQKQGELLIANLYQLSPGLRSITVQDYTDPEYPDLTIGLDPALSGIENAKRYYKLYNKAKSTIKSAQPLLEAVLEELEYLESLKLSIDQAASNEELNEIHQELIDQGYITGKHDKKTPGKKKEPDKYSLPHVYHSKSGKIIIVGRNNRQNDRMTWREAKPSDLWLHVKKIPGSHVIVPLDDGQEFPDDDTLLDAAALAVYFSQARGSSQVPVDYTHVRQIKKPRGVKPGMVVYEQNWSLLITPEEETVERLLSTENKERY